MDFIQSFAIEHVTGIKAIHIVSAVVWSFMIMAPMLYYISPAVAEAKANASDKELSRRAHWALEQYDKVAILEHVFLVIMLGSGLLLYASGLASFANGWFVAKMILVVGVLIPLEFFDIWLAHIKAPKATKALKASDPEKYAEFRDFFYRSISITAPPMVLAVLATLFLALMKPTF